MNLDPRDRKIIIGAGALLLVLVILALFIPPDQPSESEMPSSYSTSSGGAKAAYLLLEEQGYNVTRWTDSPTQLPADAQGTTLVLANPTDSPSEPEREALRLFVENGGRVLATSVFAAQMLPDSHFEAGGYGFSRREFPALIPSRITRGAPQITLTPYVRWKPSPAQLALYGDKEGAVVVKYALGKGEMIWWSGSTPLTNAGMKQPGNLELFLNCIGERSGRRILWDEYFHGMRRGVLNLLSTTPLPWLLVQVGLVMLVAMLTFSRRSGPIHEPVEPSRLTPLEYVETLGGLYRRARASDVAVQVALERFRFLLARKLGLRTNASPEELYASLQTRMRFADPDFVNVLHECESARFDSALDRRSALTMVKALQRYAVKLKLSTDSGDQVGARDDANHA